MEPPIDLLVYSSEDVSVAPILLVVAEMGLMKGEGEDLVERLSGVSAPPVPATEAELAAAAVAAAAAAAAAAATELAELKVDVETAVPPPLLASPLALMPTPPADAAAAAALLPTLRRLLLAFGVDDLGMKDEANGDPLFAADAAGILVISTRLIDGE